MPGVVDRPGDAEVHDLDVTGAGEHDVGGLDVAVDDAVTVCVVECTQGARGDLKGSFGQQSTPARQDLAERHAIDVLHDDVGDDRRLGAIDEDVFARVVDRDDVGVIQGSRGLCLTPEAGLERGITGEIGAQNLDGHSPSQPGVACLPHLGHAAPADDPYEFVAVAEGAAHAGVLRHACLPDCLCIDVPVSQRVPPEARMRASVTAAPPRSRRGRWGRRGRHR